MFKNLRTIFALSLTALIFIVTLFFLFSFPKKLSSNQTNTYSADSGELMNLLKRFDLDGLSLEELEMLAPKAKAMSDIMDSTNKIRNLKKGRFTKIKDYLGECFIVNAFKKGGGDFIASVVPTMIWFLIVARFIYVNLGVNIVPMATKIVKTNVVGGYPSIKDFPNLKPEDFDLKEFGTLDKFNIWVFSHMPFIGNSTAKA